MLALYYYEELTMKEVGTILGIGESRVSQIHSMAVIRCGPGSANWMVSALRPSVLAVRPAERKRSASHHVT